MHIEISTDSNVSGSDGLTSHTKEIVRKALIHLSDQITRVEVHLTDANADKSGQHDKHCMIEADWRDFRPPPSRMLQRPWSRRPRVRLTS
jgi:hypothetical protein